MSQLAMTSDDATLVIRRVDPAQYPPPDDAFSPSVAYPEYPYEQLSSVPNRVYAAVRQVWIDAGYDAANLGTAAWNPLREIIAEGSTVFVLCNFVHHLRPSETLQESHAKITHGSVLRAVLDYILLAVGVQGRVRFGNAPVQSAEWDQMMQETGAEQVRDFYHARGQSVTACDLRAFKVKRTMLGNITAVDDGASGSDGVAIDLGDHSLLAELDSHDGAAFRVDEYDHQRTASFHDAGKHIYLIHPDILESDVIFSLPKLKTHQKVGITCGIKGCVGSIAHKDCLAHHRMGAPKDGGDEYPDDLLGIRRLFSRFHDYVWSTEPTTVRGNLLRVVDRNLRRVQTQLNLRMGGSWHGNDTTWRMALDIARVIVHARVDGRLSDTITRHHYQLIDGIIGGDGNGPLAPQAVAAGQLIFSTDVALGDVAAAQIMGYDYRKLPIVARAFALDAYPITQVMPDVVTVWYEGRQVQLLEVTSPRPFEPPPGWVGHVEADCDAQSGH